MHHSNDISHVNGYLDIFGMPRIVRLMAIKPKRILIELPPELFRAIEDYRYSQRVPTRVEAIRQLIERGLHTTIDDDTPGENYDPGPAPKAKEKTT
jgi:hypothetical protein